MSQYILPYQGVALEPTSSEEKFLWEIQSVFSILLSFRRSKITSLGSFQLAVLQREPTNALAVLYKIISDGIVKSIYQNS